MILVYRYRVKSHLGELNRMARAVNFVWNFCNDTQKHAIKWGKKWPSGYDLMKLTTGSTKELGLPSDAINSVCAQYDRSRRQHRKARLRYRGKRSLGWIPMRADNLRDAGDGFRFGGTVFRVFKSRQIPVGARIKDGSNFSQDARGNWFLNVCIDAPDVAARPIARGVGVDLGLKELAVLSTGERIENPRHVRAAAERLAKAQRARKKRQAANIHAGIQNARRDHLHKLSTRLVREFDYIAVGNVKASALAKTKMAKSVNDASWSTLRTMLAYKSITNGATFEEVNEAFSSQVCSSCGTLPDSRPRGIADLGIRRWVCSDCGADHDRDHNAALNILARSGHRAPVEGALASHS